MFFEVFFQCIYIKNHSENSEEKYENEKHKMFTIDQKKHLLEFAMKYKSNSNAEMGFLSGHH